VINGSVVPGDGASAWDVERNVLNRNVSRSAVRDSLSFMNSLLLFSFIITANNNKDKEHKI
jgi:hypothetical protein